MRNYLIIPAVKRTPACLLWIVAMLFTAPAPLTAATFSQQELAYMPASTQIELFKQGLLSPVDVLEAQIAEFKRTNGEVNAVTFSHFETARKQAKAAETRYRKGTYRPLEGITVGVKDQHYDKGWVVTHGSLLHLHDPPQKQTHPLIQRLKDAGAILTVQTTVPELYINICTNTKAWGVTRNPWNPKYTVGGSSGGSGAALAAGYVTLATGSDGGGSIRIPAAFDGLYGYKPAYGEVYTESPLTYFAGSGPMARTFADLVLMENTIAGPNAESLNTAPTHKLPLQYASLQGMKIAYIGGMGIIKPSKEVQSAVNRAIKVLRQQGAIVKKVNLNLDMTPDEVGQAFNDITLGSINTALLAGYADKLDQMTDYAAAFVKEAMKAGQTHDPHQTEVRIKAMYKKIADKVFTKGYDVMIAPTMPTSHVPADCDVTKSTVVDRGIKYPPLVGALYTIPFNLLNWMPVMSVPVGLSSQNMPVGMQIIGKPYDDYSVFRVAYNFSKGGPHFFQGALMP